MIEEKDLAKKVGLVLNLKDQVVINSLDESKFTENQLKGSKYVELSDLKRTDIRANTDSSIRVEGNETAAQILRDGIVDLTRPDVQVGALNMGEIGIIAGQMANMSSEDQGKLKSVKQATVGSVDVLPKNSVSIQDIELDSIPEDQDIILNPTKKQMLLIGKPAENRENQKDGMQQVSRALFEEKTEEELMRKYTYFFDEYSRERSTLDRLGHLIKYGVLIYATALFLQCAIEYKQVVDGAQLFEEQESKTLNSILAQNKGLAFESLRRQIFDTKGLAGDKSNSKK